MIEPFFVVFLACWMIFVFASLVKSFSVKTVEDAERLGWGMFLAFIPAFGATMLLCFSDVR